MILPNKGVCREFDKLLLVVTSKMSKEGRDGNEENLTL